MKLTRLAILIPLLYATSAAAFEPFVVKDIRVEGIQRTEAGTVFSYLPVKVGEWLDEEHATAAIRALFATGFFKDVNLEVEKGVLIVSVRERPAIGSIDINGVKDFPKDKLAESLKGIGLAEGRIFDRSSLEKAVQELKRQYVSQGKYAVAVEGKVTPLERNRVAVKFDVVEGEASRIKQINIIGNQAYSEGVLRELMKLETPSMFSWYTKNDQYSKQKLSADLESIRSYYLDAGYLEFSLDSTQVSITPNKQDIYITINLSEGAKYAISDVKYSAPESILKNDEMSKLGTFKPGDIFSRKELTATSSKIGDRLGDDGYAFANVNAVPEVDKEKHQVAFTFMVDPGNRVYVRKANIAGNTKTRDEVIRREFRQIEGSWFAASRIKKSKQRVDRLDYFSEVNVETPPVQGTNDQVDVNLSVKEKSTGDFSLGAGLSSGEGLVLTAAITERNLFGTGNFLSTQINTSKVNTVYSVSYTNPYYTDEGMSRGFDLYLRNSNSSSTAISAYTSATMGGGVHYGIPITDDSGFRYGVSLEQTKLGLSTGSPQRFIDYVNTFGYTTLNVLGTVGWGRDTRDSAIHTTAGIVQSASAEIALPVADLRYYKVTMQQQWFHPVSHNITLMLNGEAGIGGGYSGLPMPFFKNFYAGGPGSVRGYEPMSLGPRDINNSSLGGTKRVVGNAELLFPMPGMSKEDSVRLSVFTDAGAIYGQGDLPGSAGMRSSVGAAVSWTSPVGPLKISFARPLNSKTDDKVQKFQFTLGSAF
jgi:outer membrane protein insertion porin family